MIQLQNSIKKICVAVLVQALLLTEILVPCSATRAVDTQTVDTKEIYKQEDNSLIKYIEYLSAFNRFEPATKTSNTIGQFFIPKDSSDVHISDEYNGAKNVLVWKSGKGNTDIEFIIPNDGMYNLAIEYIPLKSGPDLEIGIKIDGETPFFEAEVLTLTRDWVNATEEPRIDKQGNEISPEQIETGEYVYRLFSDNTGVNLEPFKFALSAGKHIVSLVGYGYPIAISKLEFIAPEITESYKTVSEKYDVKEDSAVEPIFIHAEDAVLKSDNSLVPKAENNNAGMTPANPYLIKINNIGANWSKPGQTITWNFNVKTAGYYSFGARYKQNELIGGESRRLLKIDGKIPFSEAKELRFKYGTGWQEYQLANGDELYYIWLDEGEHTLSLEVTLGELSEYYDRLNKIVTALGDMYLEIVMITGEVPDTNRDYELFTQIPTFTEVLSKTSKDLELLVNDMKSLNNTNGNQYTAAMNNMKRIIDRMLDAKYIAHIYVKDYYTNYTTLSSWLNEMRKMPLLLDEMQLCYAGQGFDWNQPNMFEKLWFGIKRLIYSYTDDYVSVADNDDASLKLWVNWGRDQTMALDSLIRDSFTAETGIKVELQIVSNSLINGLLANNYPDLQLHLARTDPVNYGMRGALLDLTEFPDYKEVLKCFAESADTPYWYNGALYALPDTQTFYTMFYRTDVFEQLGLSVPTTWEEFRYCATIIQRYNMSVYVPYTQITSATTVNSGIGSLHLYPTLMLQNEISLYNKELNKTNLISVDEINVFKEWTEMYTDYGYLKEADFYNRFRNGSMPLGIAPYTTYLTIYSAAPEIQGRWSIANVPGNGDNNYIAGGGTGCSIVKESKNKQEAWEFLKWWTSADTQSRYSNNVESAIGMLGRVPTANIEAFKKLSWDPYDKEKILAQWERVKELPEVPGSYYVTRAVDQAFWSVINSGEKPKDAITEWSKVADKEIDRKIKEYS